MLHWPLSCGGSAPHAGRAPSPLSSISSSQRRRPGSWRASAARWSRSWRHGPPPTQSCGGRWRSARFWCRRCGAACARRSAASWRSCVAAATAPRCWAPSCRSTLKRPPTSPASCTPRARDYRPRARAPALLRNPGPAGALKGPAARPRPPPRAPAGTGPPGTARLDPWTTSTPCQTPRSSSTPGGPRGPAPAAHASRRHGSHRSLQTKVASNPGLARARPPPPARPGPRSRLGAGGGKALTARLGTQPSPAGRSRGPRAVAPAPGSRGRRPQLPHPLKPPRLLYFPAFLKLRALPSREGVPLRG